jgi:ferrochelatase
MVGPAMSDQPAILLLAHGTPDKLSEMAEYLQKVTGGRPMPQDVVEELQHRYAQIGLRDEPLPEGPPLTRWTLKQGRLLSELLGQPVYVGMRNWHPTIADVVAQMKADGW